MSDSEPSRLDARIDDRIFHHLERIGIYARDTEELIVTRRDIKFMHHQAPTLRSRATWPPLMQPAGG